MSGLNDNAVITAAIGYVYVAEPGTAPPTPAALQTLNPETFGAQVLNLKVTGATGGTFTVTVGGTASGPIAYNASLEDVQAAIEAISTVGAGNTEVTGTSLSDSAGLSIALVGELLGGSALTFTGSATSLTGTGTPTVAATVSGGANGWTQIGHTSRDDMPDFAYKGGTYNLKGTWQRARLRQVRDKEIPADTVTVNLEQWDADTLELYFGADAAPDEDGIFGVDGIFLPVEKAFLIIIKDGDIQIGFYAPKASVTRQSAIKLPIDDFVKLPIAATFLNMGIRRLYDWISEDLFHKS